jgi:hypothetical protein
MKKYIVILLLGMTMFTFQAQTETIQKEVKIGDILYIGKSVTYGYRYIDFPKANFIIKRGGIANYNILKGEKVVVTEIAQNKKGKTEVTLERKNGRKFFRNFKSVNADIEKALASGELVVK